MTLRDTIKAAREEAEQGVSLLTGDKKESPRTERSSRKKSAASAKPAREAASTVREVKTNAKKADDLTLSKDERKMARRQEREARDMRAQALQIMLDHDEDYKRTERIWWLIIGAGFLCTVLALVLYYVFPQTDANGVVTPGQAGVIAIIVAYACIVGAFIYDWIKRRPIRRALEAKADGLSDKRLRALFEQEKKERAERKAAKQAKREAKKN